MSYICDCRLYFRHLSHSSASVTNTDDTREQKLQFSECLFKGSGMNKIHKCVEIFNKVLHILKTLEAIYFITKLPKIYNNK